MHDRSPKDAPLFVSKPLLPDLGQLTDYLQQIWTSGHVTNHGPMSLLLENRLAARLEVPTAMLFNNGTTGILAALKLFELPLGSEVITTPMTFAATAHAIAWNNLKPVFVDILERDLTIDPEAVEAAITPNTSAILAVHVYGCICDHDALARLACNHGLKLIYDAAHAFGARRNGTSVAALGDASIFSFHATKLFNTLEGGLVTTPNEEDGRKIYFLRNFGIASEESVISIGLNGKMNEIQAAIGLLNLELFEAERAARWTLRQKYEQILDGVRGITVQKVGDNATQSEQYFLTRIDKDIYGRHRDDVKRSLEDRNVYCRKYFHPICTDFDCYEGYKIISANERVYADIAKSQVLCFPFHSGVTDRHLDIISDVIHHPDRL